MTKKILLSTILSCSMLSWLMITNPSYADDYTILSPASEYDAVGYVSKYLSDSLEEVSKKSFEVKYINFGSPQEAYKKAFSSTPTEGQKLLTVITSPRFVSYIISHRSQYTLKSFYYYSSIFTSKYVLVAKNDGFITKLDDIKDYCKKYPLNVSISGIGDTGYLAFSKINQKYKCEVQYIPDKRYEKQINTIKTDNVNIGIVPLYELLPVLKKQQDKYLKTNLIPLAILGNESADQLPNVPTTQALGFNNVYATNSLYIAGLSKVPKSYHNIMQAYVNKALKNPNFIANLKSLGIKVKIQSPNDVYEDLKKQKDFVGRYYKNKPW